MHSILALLRSLLQRRGPRCPCGAPAPLATDIQGRPICFDCAAKRYTRGA